MNDAKLSVICDLISFLGVFNHSVPKCTEFIQIIRFLLAKLILKKNKPYSAVQVLEPDLSYGVTGVYDLLLGCE